MTEKRFEEYDNGFRDKIKNEYFETNKEIVDRLNTLHEENYKIKSLLLKKVKELNDDYNKSARAGMPTGGIIGELDSFEEVCRVMGWIE